MVSKRLTLLIASAHAARYNILSLDSARYKGLMTTKMLEYMEKYAYQTAIRDECMEERASGKIAMPELFDMIAGSETGAIIASSLLIKNDNPATMDIQPNKHFVDRSMQYFVNNVDYLYKDQ